MAILPSLQQLRFLCALAEQCHFGRAAESCAVTQSTLSGGIKELEARLGITLFERSHRHVMLTPLGKEIATRAQRLLVDAEELVGFARNAQEPLSGPLRFGVIPTVGPYVLPSLLSHLGAALPKLKLHVREAPTTVLLDKLASSTSCWWPFLTSFAMSRQCKSRKIQSSWRCRATILLPITRW
jgi:LysR family hydrogen peroxide-inducible transcriptional activator